MPFGEFKDFADCVSKNKDKENPEAYCSELHKKITGEWPGAVKEADVIDLIDRYMMENPEADISIKAVESIISAFSKWAGSDPGNYTKCVKTLTGKDGISDAKALCAWLHHEALGIWPAEKSTGPDLAGPIVIKSSLKKIVVGPVLVPGEADHEGESLTADKIEDVAYHFMSDFRYVDISHTLKQVGIPVSSDVLRQPETHVLKDGSRLELPKGTWMLGVKVEDPETWRAVESGAMKGFSIMGVSRKTLEAAGKSASAQGLPLGSKIENGQVKKILLSDLGPDWVAVAVSILPNPSVFKSRFIAIKEAGEKDGILTRLLKRFAIKGNPDQKSDDDNKSKMEETDMEPKDVQEMIDKALGPVMEEIKKLTPKPADPKPEPAKADGDKEPDKAPEPDKEPETTKPPETDDLKAQVDKVAGEIEAVKGTLADINKSMKNLTAVKSQGLPQGGTADSKPIPGPERDVFGRAKK